MSSPDQRHEWRCFHCDEVFTDRDEAKEHFGDYQDDTPMCLIKGADGGFAARIRELEAEVAEAYRQRNECENDARLWHESEADRVRRIGHCQWWQEMDSREGEKLVLQAEIERLKTLAQSLDLNKLQALCRTYDERWGRYVENMYEGWAVFDWIRQHLAGDEFVDATPPEDWPRKETP